MTNLIPNDSDTKEELQNSMETPSLSENFSLANYEDDDDESGFYCPCCLPR